MATMTVAPLSTDDDGFTTVSYARRPRSQDEKALARREALLVRQAQLVDTINKDPAAAFLFKKSQEQELTFQRMRRDPTFVRLSDADIWARIISAPSESMPTVLRKKGGLKPHQVISQARRVANGDFYDRVSALDERPVCKIFAPDFIKACINKRFEMGLTQAELAFSLSIPAVDINDFERGELPYSGGFQARIRNALNL